MKVSIKGKLLSIYKATDFTDKQSGEVSEGKNKLQMLIPTTLSNGIVKNDLMDISIPKEQLKDYESKVGKDIDLECAYVSKSPVSFYVSI